MIQTRILKGFRDYLPDMTIPRQEMIRSISKVFASHGYSPIDTPALEYSEILLGKGSEETDKQLYRFQDNGKRDVALRFDLTIPLARFAAMHIDDLGVPFKRYHIAPVWRAEKPQRGRFREFIQCDIDTIGTESSFADAEILAVISRALSSLEVKHQFRINNRKILNGLLESLNAVEDSVSILRALDKLEKAGIEAVSEELQAQTRLTKEQIKTLFSLMTLSEKDQTCKEVLNNISQSMQNSQLVQEGVKELQEILEYLKCYELNYQEPQIDLTIARGLDYYTSTVFETRLSDLPEIGSISSGGRYDNLVGIYSKRSLPGVGCSIGLDRLLAALQELKRLPDMTTTSQVLLTWTDKSLLKETIALADSLRLKGFAAEVYLESAKLSKQLKYANRKNIPFVTIAGPEELEKSICSVKDLNKGNQHDNIPLSQVADLLHSLRNES